ncbi:MAG: polysaccharide deacetylase family protein [Erysipelotrichaceae bacterium]
MKKRNKKSIQCLVLALGFVCFFTTLTACSPAQEKKKKATIDVSKYFSDYVIGEKEVSIFKVKDNKHIEIGKVMANKAIALAPKNQQKMNQRYFKLRDYDYYIKANEVTPDKEQVSERISQAYQPIAKLTSKANYQLLNEMNEPLIKMNEATTFDAFIDDGTRYGISINQTLYYLNKNDIAAIENVNPSEASAQSLPVLMYHVFYDASKGEVGPDGNWVEVQTLRSHLQYLKDNGYVTLTMKDVERYLDNKVNLKQNVVSITMDDGSKTVYDYAYPLLKEFQMKATAFLITGEFNDIKDTHWPEMAQNGIELQSHSEGMHVGGCSGMGRGGRLMCVDLQTGIDDTKQSFQKVGNGFVYCYPYGDANDHAVEIVRQGGARLAFTTQYGKIAPGMDKLRLPRIRIFGQAGLDRFIEGIK